MPDYRRFRVPGGTYFFTVNLLERRLDTLVRYVDVLRSAVRVTRQERPFHIDAWVVLPNHMHCVWTFPPGDDDYSNRWKAIKACHEDRRTVGWGECNEPQHVCGNTVCVGVRELTPTYGYGNV